MSKVRVIRQVGMRSCERAKEDFFFKLLKFRQNPHHSQKNERFLLVKGYK